MNPRFTISILAFDGIAQSRRCLESIFLAGTKRDEAELILTDNGSTDGTAEYFDEIARTHAHVRVVHNRVNLGFGVPNNRALAMARGEFFVTLNNDTRVPSGWLEKLAEPFEKSAKVGQTGAAGGCSGLTRNFDGIPSEETEYVQASCMMIRTSVARCLRDGLFARYLYFAYCEDTDLSLRLREQGYEISLVDIDICHEGASTSQRVPGIREIESANKAICRQRWIHYLRTKRFDAPTIVKRHGGAWGDVLLMTPVLAALRRERPLSQIYVEAPPCIEVLDGNPNAFQVGAHFPGMSDAHVIDLAGAYECRPGLHIIDAYALAARVTTADRRTEIHIPADDMRWAQSRIGSDGAPWVALHVGPSHWPGKNWPDKRWADVMGYLSESGWNLIVFGQGGMSIAGGPVEVAPPVKRFAALVSLCGLFVGLDSFPLHVAGAVGTKAIGLFGTTLPQFILADGDNHGVCADPNVSCAGDRHRVHGKLYVQCDGACMESITVEDVIEAIKRVTK